MRQGTAAYVMAQENAERLDSEFGDVARAVRRGIEALNASGLRDWHGLIDPEELDQGSSVLRREGV